MQQITSPNRLLALALILLAMLLPIASTPARGAEPGAELLNFSGSLNAAVPSRTVPLAESGPANLRLAVSGGAASDRVTLSLLDSAGKTLKSWAARSGETLWGFAELPAGAKLRVQTSGAALGFDLRAYARGTILAPAAGVASWSGVAIGAAAQTGASEVQLVVPAAGLYKLTLGATSGAYQLTVNDSYLRKTVVSGKLPAAADSTYFLPAGEHTFRITPDPSAGVTTAWSLQAAAAGASDSLPYAESAAALGGGTGGGFSEERLPIQVAAAGEVNLRIAAGGAPGDSIQIELYNGASKVFSSSAIAGGEVVWATSRLAAGANALRVVAAAGNGAPLSYSLTVSALLTPKVSWAGTSYGGSAASSTARAVFARGGLYSFTLGAGSGGYQLRLNDSYLRKIVTAAGASFSAYVPAGTHTLVLDQDSSAATAWSVTIEAAAGTADSLPFTRSGGRLGGAGGDFRNESLPIQLAAAQAVNIRIAAAGGGPSDSLRVELFAAAASAPSFSAATVFKDEVYWATSSLPAGTSLLRVSAADGNTAPMEYQVEIRAVGAIPTSWSGVARGAGLSSGITLNAPSDGVYSVVLTVDTGAGQVLIDGGAAPRSATPAGAAVRDSTSLTLRVPLDAGPHRFSFVQDQAQASTSWQIATSLVRQAIPLSVSRLTPAALSVGSGGEIEVTGAGFESGTTVALLNGAGTAVASSAVVVSGTRIMLSLPSSTPIGVYTLRLSNPGGDTLSRPAAVSVGRYKVFLPQIVR